MSGAMREVRVPFMLLASPGITLDTIKRTQPRVWLNIMESTNSDDGTWLSEDPPTWNFPDDTPPHVMAGLRRLFSRVSLFDNPIRYNPRPANEVF